MVQVSSASRTRMVTMPPPQGPVLGSTGPERDHRGDRCPATLATRDGRPSQPVAAYPSTHAARLPRRTRSSPWATALALGGARGSAQLNWQPKPPVPRTGCQHPPRAGPMCPRWRRAAFRGLGHARPHAPAHVAGAAPVSRPRSCHRPFGPARIRRLAQPAVAHRGCIADGAGNRSANCPRRDRGVIVSVTTLGSCHGVRPSDHVTRRSDRLRLPG